MIARTGSLSDGIAAAMLSAGPIFVAMLGLHEAYRRFPGPIDTVSAGDLLLMIPMAPAVIAIGGVLSIPAILVGGLTMRALGTAFAWTRLPLLWIVAGAGFGVAIACLFARESPPSAFALIATSALCAGICRRPVIWEEPAEKIPIIYRWPRLI